jgi:hypothetical protein
MRYGKHNKKKMEGAKMKENTLDLSYIKDSKKELYLLNIKYNLGIKSKALFDLDNLLITTKKGA